jgi:hypothetical protein
MSTGERDTLGQALAYADAGWPVFPQAPGGKAPAIRNPHPEGSPERAACRGECGRDGHGLHDATTDPDKIRYWWSKDPDRNIGIATGAPGPDVVDIDVRESGTGMPAYQRLRQAGLLGGEKAIVRTPSTGLHLYFAGTNQPCGQIRGQHVELKASGGSITAPPSRRGGAQYVVVRHRAEPAAAVSWDAIRGHLEPQRQQEHERRGPVRDAGDAGRVDRLADWAAQGQAGLDRNSRIFWAAREAARAGLLDPAAEQRLVEAAERSGLRGGEREARTAIASGRRAADREAPPQRPFAPTPQREPDNPGPAALTAWNQAVFARHAQRDAEAGS